MVLVGGVAGGSGPAQQQQHHCTIVQNLERQMPVASDTETSLNQILVEFDNFVPYISLGC